MDSMCIIIPTYNAAPYLPRLLDSLLGQTRRAADILVIDSTSSDDTVRIAKSRGARTLVIPKADFDHGGTRTLAARNTEGSLLIYLTQDALPADRRAVEHLLEPLWCDPAIGIVFGRQLPSADATPFARHLRYFNYPAESHVRTLQDKKRFGIKTAFCSNSFAAYRRSALEDIGWFKAGLLMGEDSHACARMLLKGYKVAYAAEAAVFHSHNYRVVQDFQRYFDMGAFLQKEHWILDTFGKAEGEGFRFVQSEVAYLLREGLWRDVPVSLLRAAAKWSGYRLGHFHAVLPRSVVRRVSMYST
jgi:rhamnosyltransferase